MLRLLQLFPSNLRKQIECDMKHASSCGLVCGNSTCQVLALPPCPLQRWSVRQPRLEWRAADSRSAPPPATSSLVSVEQHHVLTAAIDVEEVGHLKEQVFALADRLKDVSSQPRDRKVQTAPADSQLVSYLIA